MTIRTLLRTAITLSALATALFLGPTASVAANVDTPTYESFKSITVSGITAQTDFGSFNAQGEIRVASDGTRYTNAMDQDVTYFLSGGAEVSSNKWRLFRAVAGIGGLFIDAGVPGGPSSNFGSYHAVGVNEMPVKKLSLANVAIRVPLDTSGLGAYAAARCNANRTALRDQGLSDIAIFREDRSITIPVAFHLAVQAHDRHYGQNGPIAEGQSIPPPTERYWRQATAWQNMPVRCLKKPDLDLKAPSDATPVPQGPQTLQQPVGVSQVFATMLPDAYHGPCPAPLNLSVVVSTNGPTSVKYRVEHSDGTLSPIASVAVDQTHTAMFSIPVPVGRMPPKDIGGIAGIASGTGHDAATTLAARPGEGFQGAYRIRIVAPNSVVSNYASYRVTCKAAITGSDAIAVPKPGPGGLPLPAASKRLSTEPAPAIPGALRRPSQTLSSGTRAER